MGKEYGVEASQHLTIGVETAVQNQGSKSAEFFFRSSGPDLSKIFDFPLRSNPASRILNPVQNSRMVNAITLALYKGNQKSPFSFKNINYI